MSLCSKAWTLDNPPLQHTPGPHCGFSWHKGRTGGPVLLNLAVERNRCAVVPVW
jgi:hypothetical protein